MTYGLSIGWCGPWDPWETHYGEVARNIVVRSDPLDLWWTPSRWGPDRRYESMFASKHVLPFWAMAASMSLFGMGNSRDPAELVFSPVAELSLRLPSLLAGLATVGFVAFVATRCHSRRVGIASAFVLATMPLFAIVSRQALTDMFLAGPVMLGWGCWAMAWFAPDRALTRRRVGRLDLPWDRAHGAFLVLFVVAAVLPLAVLQHHVASDVTIARVGKFSVKPGVPSLDTLTTIGRHLLPYWIVVIAVLAQSLRWQTRRDAWLGMLWIAAGLSVLGKGILGPALIGVAIVIDSWASGHSRRLLQTGLVFGALAFVVVAVPWHHAMALYRGERWIRELIFENNLARFSSGEQDQAVGTATFYVRTLAISAFPWSVLLPAVAWRARYRRASTAIDRQDAADSRTSPASTELIRFAALAATTTFLTITYSVTKYNHYLLPCLPPLAIVIGVWLADTRPHLDVRRHPGAAVVIAAGLVGTVLVVRELVQTPAWIAHLTTVYYDGVWREGAPPTDLVAWLAMPVGIGLVAWALGRVYAGRVAIVLGAALFTAYVLNDYLPRASAAWSQRDLFRHYFANRAHDDRLVSWWLHHRGETYFSKRQLWMSISARSDELETFIDESRAQGRGMWFVTQHHGQKRLRNAIPRRLRDDLRLEFATARHALMYLPPPDGP